MGTRKLEGMVAGTMAVAALSAITAIVLILLPYNPLTFYSLQTQPAPLCPGDAIRPNVDYEINPDQFDGIRILESRSTWVAVDVKGLPVDTRRIGAQTTLDKSLLQPGRTTAPGQVLRIAPEEPGSWRLKIDLTLRGSRYGFPKVQETQITSDKETVVLEKTDSRCSG